MPITFAVTNERCRKVLKWRDTTEVMYMRHRKMKRSAAKSVYRNANQICTVVKLFYLFFYTIYTYKYIHT